MQKLSILKNIQGIRCCLLISLTVSSYLGFTQSEEIDSLKNVLIESNDTTKVLVYKQLGIKYRRHDSDLSIEYLEKGIQLARDIQFVVGEIECLLALGTTHGMLGNYPESLLQLNQGIARANEFRLASFISRINNTLGIVYKRIGDYPTSLDYYLKNLALQDSMGTIEGKANTYSNLGILYDLMKEPEKSLESYQYALELGTSEGLKFNVISNIAVLHFNVKEYKKALGYFLQVLEYDRSIDDQIKLCIANSNVGICYVNLGEWKSAEEHLYRAKEIAEKLALKQELTNLFYNIARLHFKQDQLDKALRFSKENLAAAQNIKSFSLKKEAHEQAYEIHKARNELSDAIHHFEKYSLYKDSLLNETKVKELENLEVKHSVFAKDKEIQEQNLELDLLNARVKLESRRMWHLAIIALLSIISASALFIRYRGKQRSNLLLREKTQVILEQKKEIEEINMELEKRMLRAQMNPHFIFNSLSSIQHFITSNDKVSALTYLTKFSNLLRQVLESSININLILEEEIRLLKIYVELEALRFDGSFEYEFIVDDQLDIYNQEIPMLLLQPYIENAIIHGLMPKKGDKNLTIRFTSQGEYIHCEIIDNGIGRVKAKELKAQSRRPQPSRGMSVSEQRLHSLEKHHGEELVQIEDLQDGSRALGTKISIKIPKA